MFIKALRLPAADLSAQLHFYTQLLELPLAHPAEPTQFTLQTGRSQLTFAQAKEGENGRYHFAFNIPPNQFAAAKQWLTGRLPLIHDEHGTDEFDFRSWNARALYFFDPAGNIVELIARRDLPDQATTPFGHHSLLSISEIGLATADVAATAELARTTLGLEPYRGSVSHDFTAVGDEHGLLIIVQQGRLWYPNTGVAAELYPLKVLLNGKGGATHQITYQISKKAPKLSTPHFRAIDEASSNHM
jgi:catechol-2,3-dioxygenase